MSKNSIKFEGEKRRDFSIVLTCQQCGEKYYPPKGKVGLSKFCTPQCARKSVGHGRL